MESIEASILSSWGMENKDVALLLARIITIRLNLPSPSICPLSEIGIRSLDRSGRPDIPGSRTSDLKIRRAPHLDRILERSGKRFRMTWFDEMWAKVLIRAPLKQASMVWSTQGGWRNGPSSCIELIPPFFSSIIRRASSPPSHSNIESFKLEEKKRGGKKNDIHSTWIRIGRGYGNERSIDRNDPTISIRSMNEEEGGVSISRREQESSRRL